MDGIRELLEGAWAEVSGRFEEEPWELERRVARRRSKTFGYVPRAWCLAIRAGDTRLNVLKCSHIPEWEEGGKRVRREHVVYVDAEEVRRLCRPYFIPRPGLSVRELSGQLGLDEDAIRTAIRRGILRAEPARGVRGRKELRVNCDVMLDPANIARPLEDCGWGTKWKHLVDYIPGDLKQGLVRRPKGLGHRLGDWVWVCPGCGEEAEKIFYPLAWPRVAGFVRWAQTGGLDDVPEPVGTFACRHCHKVRSNSRVGRGVWNELVTFLSGGLLYGKEVERPAWWGEERRRAFGRRERGRRSKVRRGIEEMLVGTDLVYRQMAAELGTTTGTVGSWAALIFKDRGVKNREELREKAGMGSGSGVEGAGA